MGRATEPEQRFLSGLVAGELRQGALASLVVDAVARATDLPADDEGAAAALQRFLHDGVDLARVAGLYNVGSGSAGVVRALAAAGLDDRRDPGGGGGLDVVGEREERIAG